MISGGRTEQRVIIAGTEQLNIFCRVTVFTSEFLSFIVVEHIGFFHRVLHLLFWTVFHAGDLQQGWWSNRHVQMSTGAQVQDSCCFRGLSPSVCGRGVLGRPGAILHCRRNQQSTSASRTYCFTQWVWAFFSFSALTWLGNRKGFRPVKNCVSLAVVTIWLELCPPGKNGR